ncbi:MAG TPA: peptidoglycan DD-metalloendopeptidase family protein [Nitrospirota bacterium]|nr:peptidoglycan DD-metalloendopeptidase family protein [Nitrospirota bacterium]
MRREPDLDYEIPGRSMSNPRIGILVLLFFLLAGHGPHAYGADDTAGKKKELQRIKREMSEKQQKIKRADRKERSILSELDKIDRDIHAGSVELAGQQKRLHEAEASLRDIEMSNAEISRDLVTLKKVYAYRVRALYKMSRSGYVAEVITSDGVGEAVKRIKYLGMIAERDRLMMREYGSALGKLAARQAEVAEKKDDILRSKRAVETKKAELETRKHRKAEILGSVRGEKSLYEQALRELEESSVSLWAMIKKAEREKKAVTAAALPRRPSATSISEKSRLPWPVDGQVLTRFGIQRHPQFGTTVFRRGIEIEAHDGESVRAVSDGQVAYADWYKGYGELVILEHGNGLYTLYGNLSRLDLKKGDRVAKGKVIGLAGDTGSPKGSRLYFEIRQNGEAQDPLAWLSKR